MRLNISLFILIILVLFINSCQDDPGSLGNDLIPDKDRININTTNSLDGDFNQYSSIFSDSVGLGYSNRVLLGLYNGLKSEILMKFIFIIPDSVTDAYEADSLQILESCIEMKPSYKLGSTIPPDFDFQIHEITSAWSSLGFSRDSLAGLTFDNRNLGSSKTLLDTVFSISFDNDIVYKWISRQITETGENNYGVLFTPESQTKGVVGFNAISTISEIEDMPKLKIIISKPGEFIDTLLGTPTADIHVITGDFPQSPENNIVLQVGYTTRAKFVMDVSSLPTDIIINEATLHFYKDTVNSSIGSISSDSLIISMYGDSAQTKLSTNFVSVIFTRSGNEYSGKITGFVQSWLKSNSNYGVQVRLSDELRTMNRLELFSSSNPDKSFRPRLKLIYTTHN